MKTGPLGAALAIAAALALTGCTPSADATSAEGVATIGRYQPGGAATYLAELRSELASCPRQEHGGTTVTTDWATVATGFVADESMLLSAERSYDSPSPAGGRNSYTFYQALVRGGGTVIILYVYGWEASSAQLAHLERLLQAALTRATA
jgi:hypothetical protein